MKSYRCQGSAGLLGVDDQEEQEQEEIKPIHAGLAESLGVQDIYATRQAMKVFIDKSKNRRDGHGKG